MATSDEMKQAAIRELARRELARRAEARAAGEPAGPAAPMKDPQGEGALPSSWDEASARASANWSAVQDWSNRGVKAVLGDKPSVPRYMAALALQGANPATAGDVGQLALMDNPVAQQSALMMEEGATDMLGPKWGPRLAAYTQAVTQMLPGALATGAVGSLVGGGARAAKAATTATGLLGRGLWAGAKGAAAGGAENAVMGVLGAPAGSRVETGLYEATNPVALALGGIAPMAATAVEGVRMARRADAAGHAAAVAENLAPPVAAMPGYDPAMPAPLRGVPPAPNWTGEFPRNRSPMAGPSPTAPYAEGFSPATADALGAVMDPARIPPPGVTGTYEQLDMMSTPPEVRDPILRARANDLSSRVPTIVDNVGQPAMTRPPGATQTMNQRVKPLSPEALDDLPSTSIYDTQVVPRTQVDGDLRAAGMDAPKTKAAWFRSNEMRRAKTQVDAVPPAQAAAAELDAATSLPGMAKTGVMEWEDAARIRGEAQLKSGIGGGSGGKPPTDPVISAADQWRKMREESVRSDPRTVESGGPAPQPGPLPSWAPIPNPFGAAMPPLLRRGGNGPHGTHAMPIPGPGVIPGKAPAAAPPASLAAMAASERFDPRLSQLEKLTNDWLLPEFRAAPLAAEAVRGWRAALHIQNEQMARVFPQLKRAYDRAVKADPGAKRVMDAYFRQHLNREIPAAGRIPESVLPPEFRDLFRDGMAQIEQQRLELAQAGYFTPSELKVMADLQAKGLQWMHRDYRAYQDKGWVPRRDVSDRAIDYIVKKSNGKLNRVGAKNELWALFNGEGDVQSRFMQSNLNQNILKARQGIPAELRAALGVIEDPSYLVANSMAEMERMYRQYKTSQAFTAPDRKGIVWDDNPNNPAMHANRVWLDKLSADANKKMFGEFAGKYVTPELYESVVQQPMVKQASSDLFVSVFKALTSAMKVGKIALSPSTYVLNWLSNSAYAAAGGLPWWNVPKLTSRMSQSWDALAAYGDTFRTMKSNGKNLPVGKDAQWVQWALEDSALIGGTGMEFGGSQAKQIAARFLRDPNGGIKGLFEAGMGKLDDVKANLGKKYDNLDSHWRLAVYIEQVTKGRDRLGLSIPEARARASRIVNRNFASAGSTGNMVKEMGRKGGFMAPFMTWHADNLRVHGNWFLDSRKIFTQGLKATDQRGNVVGGNALSSGEGAGQALNLAIHYGAVGFGLFEFMRRMSGFTDEDVKGAEASLKGYSKGHMPWREWLPFRDSQGRAQVLSMSSFIPTASFLAGNPEDSLLKRALINSIGGFTSGGLAEGGIEEQMALVGLGDGPRGSRPILPGDRMRRWQEAAWNYLQPGAIRDARDIARRTGVYGIMRENEEALTTGQAIARIATLNALKVEPVGAKSQLANRRMERGKVSDLRNNPREIRRLPIEASEKAALMRATREELARQVKQRSRRSKDIRREK